MGVVSTIPERCRRCYTCVRECPAKAIKVEAGQAMVIEERCIACGNCVKVCAQKAKLVQLDVPDVQALLRSKQDRVFACLAPTFPVAFHPTPPGKIVAAVRALGFSEVWEVAFGAELVSQAYVKLFEELRPIGARMITTACPAIVAFIDKYMPSLHGALAPIVSPMIAVARAIRHLHGPSVKIVFIGPCIAKKDEIRDPFVSGTVNSVLTFRELSDMFVEAGIVPDSLTESGFDSPRCHIGRSFPISGGLLKTAGLSTDILQNDIVVTEGKDRVLAALQELEEGKSKARFFDILFCEGCIDGPKVVNTNGVLVRKEIMANFVHEQSRYSTQRDLVEAMARFSDVDLRREFTTRNLRLPDPTEEDILDTLKRMKKYSPEDQLNCGSCGYPTCRQKAIAVCQGLAEPEMCLPYLVEELEATCDRLELSHKELASAQQRLIHSERLASMGQLSAGVAHEINNPLGTVLIYSHLLLKQLKENDPLQRDLTMIVNEANRCKEIVRGLLDFARQSRVSKAPTRLEEIVQEAVESAFPRAVQTGVRIQTELPPDLPIMMIDRVQIRQALVNLLHNGIDAISGPGTVRIEARLKSSTHVEILVSDNGSGIPEEHLSKIFTPFFTTKETDKGTGLGLAIVYGIVKMHSGDITVESQMGKGSTFRIELPIGDRRSGESVTASEVPVSKAPYVP